MTSNLLPRTRSKKWNQVYSEKLFELEKVRQQKTDENKKHATLMMEKLQKKNVSSNLLSCKHTIENATPPKQSIPWNIHWSGIQLTCILCGTPALNDCIKCSNCNSVVHQLCVQNHESSFDNEVLNSKYADVTANTSEENALTSTFENYRCPNCEESMDAELERYYQLTTALKKQRFKFLSSSIIIGRALVYLEKKRFARKRHSAIKIQSTFRGFSARKSFLSWRTSQFRIIELEFTHVPDWAKKSGLIIVSAIDSYKNLHLFRIDKTVEEISKESFIIPGINSKMSLVISIALKESSSDISQLYVIICQSQITLRDLEDAFSRNTFTLNMTDKIRWMPQEIKGGIERELITPATARQMQLQTYQQQQLASLSTGSAITSPKHSVFSQNFINSCLHRDCNISFNFIPQNPLFSYCQLVFAPPLDTLKKSSESRLARKKINSSGGTNYRTSRYWLCIHKLKLIFFQYYGDATPRFICDATEATASVTRDKEGSSTPWLNIYYGEKEFKVSWLIEFKVKYDACRFEFAVNEAKKIKLLYLDHTVLNSSGMTAINNFPSNTVTAVSNNTGNGNSMGVPGSNSKGIGLMNTISASSNNTSGHYLNQQNPVEDVKYLTNPHLYFSEVLYGYNQTTIY